MKIPDFDTREELYKFLVANKSRLIADKKAQIKQADAVSHQSMAAEKEGESYKAAIDSDVDSFYVKAVINTTNLMDSHDDVHIPGLWKKSLKENKDIYHDQEHLGTFSSTISDYEDLKARTETMSWKELGYKFEGETEALVFVSHVRKERNEFMFNQYKAGRVRQHSVGMRYIKIEMAINSKAYPDEFKVWEKYRPMIANGETADEKGYFWAVTEAKAFEGSAVKRGSNWATPTEDISTEPIKEPPEGTPTVEPVKVTQLTSEEIIKAINKHFNS